MNYDIVNVNSINNFNSIVIDKLNQSEINFELVRWTIDGQYNADDLSIYKTIVLKSKDNDIVVVGLPVYSKVDYSKLSQETGYKRLTFIDDLEKLTSMKPKACSLLVLDQFNIILDRTYQDFEYFYISSANKDVSVKLKSKDLVEIIDFIELDLHKQ